jgi:hypothetical protein
LPDRVFYYSIKCHDQKKRDEEAKRSVSHSDDTVDEDEEQAVDSKECEYPKKFKKKRRGSIRSLR